MNFTKTVLTIALTTGLALPSSQALGLPNISSETVVLSACGAFFAYALYALIKNNREMSKLSDQELIAQATAALEMVYNQYYYQHYITGHTLPAHYTPLVSYDMQTLARLVKYLKYRRPLTTNAALFSALYTELRNCLEIVSEIQEELEKKFPDHDNN
mgnify:CR=1 FL=1